MPWWAVLASILASEISAGTFLGTPSEGYAKLNFLYAQLVIGTILARIIADLRDADGRITIPGFYDGVPEPSADLLAGWAKASVPKGQSFALLSPALDFSAGLAALRRTGDALRKASRRQAHQGTPRSPCSPWSNARCSAGCRTVRVRTAPAGAASSSHWRTASRC